MKTSRHEIGAAIGQNILGFGGDKANPSVHYTLGVLEAIGGWGLFEASHSSIDHPTKLGIIAGLIALDGLRRFGHNLFRFDK